MKRKILVLAAMLMIFGCAQAPPELLIDGFEGELSIDTVDFGSSLDSTIKVEADKNMKVCGEQSLKISYNLDPKGYMWCARGYNLDVKGAAKWLVKPQAIRWASYDALELSMYGSKSGRIIAFDIKDCGGEIWRTILKDDFEGWRQITCPFDKFFARSDWQPDTADKNEKIDFPVMSFQFEPRTPGKGTCYFDQVKVIRLEESNQK